MKTNISICLSFMAVAMLNAQENQTKPILSGKVMYEESIVKEMKVTGGDALPQAFIDKMNKPKKYTKVLFFNESASLYSKPKSNQPEDTGIVREGGNITMNSSTAMSYVKDIPTFTDFSKKTQVMQHENYDRFFLVTEDISAFAWKLTGNEKSILGYSCKEAVREDEEGKKSVAWFTPMISVPAGPANFLNLPGLVLEADYNEGKTKIIATSVEGMPVSEEMIPEPKKGKKVSRKEYNKLMAEKKKEFDSENANLERTVLPNGAIIFQEKK